MNNDSFADGILAIRLANGMVRVEYGTLSIAETGEDGNPKVEKSFRVVMTPQGFLKSFSKMERMIHVLIEGGIIVDMKQDDQSGPARDASSSIAVEERRESEPERRKYSVKPRE